MSRHSSHRHSDKNRVEVEQRADLQRPKLTEQLVRDHATVVRLRLSDLDGEMERQGGNLAWWETLAAAARYELSQTELQEELREARLDGKARLEITKRLTKEGSGRLTEAMVKAYIKEDSLWQEQHEKVMVAKEWLNILEGVCKALFQKGQILSGLARSHNVDYADEDRARARRHLDRRK